MSNITKVIASVTKIHGGTREQVSKHDSFIAWQLRARAERNGADPSPILKQITTEDL